MWRGDWVDGQGNRRRQDLAEKRADAERILAMLIRERDLELAGMSAERGLSMTLEDVAAQYLADMRTRARPGSVANARASLALLQRDLPGRAVRDIARPAIAAWRARRVAAGASNKTANNDVAVLHAALQFCVRSGQLAANPLAGLRALPIGAEHRRREPRPLSEWEIGRLLAAAGASDRRAGPVAAREREQPTSVDPVPLEPLLRALLLTGARWGELTSATWADLNLDAGTLTLRAETTKTGRARTVPIERALLELIAELPAHVERVSGRRPGAGDRIFVTRVGKPWSTSRHFGRWLDKLYTAAGIPKRDTNGRVVHVHALRHSAATRMARSGAPISVTQKLLGHSTPYVTQRIYIAHDVDDVRRAIEALPALPSPGVENAVVVDPHSAQA